MRKSFPKTARLLALAMLVAGTIAGCSSSQNIAAPEAAATSPAGSIISDPRVNAIVMNSCYGCHSNEGSPPWYATIAPSYWSDRSGARGALNFSDWQTYDAQRKAAGIQAIATAVSTGSMPPTG